MNDFAFVPVIGNKETPWNIGAAFENERGYNKTTYEGFKTQDEAAGFCEMMNSRMGLTEREADLIIISSMRTQNNSSEGK